MALRSTKPGLNGAGIIGAGVLGLIAVGLAIGVVTTGMSADALSAGRPEAALRWRADDAAALSAAAAAKVDDGDYEGAGRFAREALQKSALDARALRTLGQVANASGDRSRARALTERAIDINPRDGRSAGWLFDDAMAVGQYDKAMAYADGLMRRSEAAAGRLPVLLVPYATIPEARAAMAERLAAEPPWRASFLRVAARSANLETTGALFEALVATRKPPTDRELTPFFQRLVSAGRYEDAEAYWPRVTKLAPRDRPPFVYDGGFEGLRGPMPLTWEALRVRGGSALFELDDGHPLGALRLRHDGFSSTSPMVRQLIFLPVGGYTLRARTMADDPAADRKFRMEVVCVNGARITWKTLEAAPGRWEEGEVDFDVPATGCSAQWLLFRPEGSDRSEPVEVRIDDVEISEGLSARAAATPGGPL